MGEFVFDEITSLEVVVLLLGLVGGLGGGFGGIRR
jgi:hypothetical protein